VLITGYVYYMYVSDVVKNAPFRQGKFSFTGADFISTRRHILFQLALHDIISAPLRCFVPFSDLSGHVCTCVTRNDFMEY